MQDSFIIDNSPSGAWVWIGKKSSPKEKKEAMRNAVVCTVFLIVFFYDREGQWSRFKLIEHLIGYIHFCMAGLTGDHW